MPTADRRRCPHSKMIVREAKKCEAALWRSQARMFHGDYSGSNADLADAQYYSMQAFRLARGRGVEL
jgi:hypothetical protein